MLKAMLLFSEVNILILKSYEPLDEPFDVLPWNTRILLLKNCIAISYGQESLA